MEKYNIWPYQLCQLSEVQVLVNLVFIVILIKLSDICPEQAFKIYTLFVKITFSAENICAQVILNLSGYQSQQSHFDSKDIYTCPKLPVPILV